MANNIIVADANGVPQTVSTTQTAGVHTPHHIVDSGTISVNNFPGTQTVNGFVSVNNFPVIQPVVGHSGASFDGPVTPAAAPANAVVTSSLYNTTAPAPSNGQAMSLQSDWQGSVFVRGARRSSTVAQASAIVSSSSPVTALNAAGANIFADITTLVLTVTAAATTDLAFTVTLSDGTANYIFDLDTGALATSVGVPVPLVINFSVPLPASSAATAWTITSSSAAVTVHCTVVAVLQKAS
jgi:hypothetical protein